jgi:hypothetical protein
MVAVTFPVNSDPQLRGMLAPGFDPANQTPPQRLNAQHNNETFLYLPRTAFDLAFYVYRKGVAGPPADLGARDTLMYLAWQNGNGGAHGNPAAPMDLATYYSNLINRPALKAEYEAFNAWMIGQINAWVASGAARPSIEAELARQHLSDGTLVLYDVSLCAELAQPSTIGMPEATSPRRSYPS